MSNEWLLIGAALLAGAIASVSGFGVGSLLTPVLMLDMPAANAIAILAIPHALATMVRLARLRADVHWPTFREFGVASAAGGLAGAAWQSQLASPALTVVLALLLISAGLAEVVRRPIPLPPTRRWRLAGGVLSGLFGGLVGNQGGIRAAALLGLGLPPRQLVATATASALLVDAARVPIYLVTSGDAIAAGARVAAVAAAGVIVGTWLGVPVLRKIPEPVYRRLVGALLLILGIALVVT